MEKNEISIGGEYIVEHGTVEQAVELAGTHRIILKTHLTDIRRGDIVELQNAERVCGAVVHGVHLGNKRIVMGNPLRSHLKVKKGDIVSVKKIEAMNAKTIIIGMEDALVDEAKERITESIKSQLMDQPLYEGENIMVLITNKPFEIHIRKTKPFGVVTVSRDTNIIFEKEEEKEREKKIPIALATDNPNIEIPLEEPDVSFNHVGGLYGVKKTLKRIAFVIKNPEISKKVGVKPANVFLYGPPGTGKTLLAKAMARECNTNFVSIGCADIESKWVGEAVKRIRAMFSQAAQHAPCIIFFDEFDAIAHTRGDAHDPTRDITNQLLIELNEPKKGIFVIAATNRIDLIDEAILRRFPYKVEVGLPDEDARREIIRIHLNEQEVEDRENVTEWLVKISEGISGSDIKDIVEKAGYEALDEIIEGKEAKINRYHFEKVLREHKTPPPEREMYIG